MHPSRGGATAPILDVVPVVTLVEDDSEFLEPVHDQGRVLDQGPDHLGLVRVVTAADRVKEVPVRRVYRTVRCLCSTLGHDGVAVTVPQLVDEQNLLALHAVVLRQKRGRGPGEPPTDDHHINLVVGHA